MGKRELIIIVAFVAAGALAYRLTAPPATGKSAFSLGDFVRTARTELRGNPGRGAFVHTGSIPAGPGVREVRLIGISENLRILGDARATIDYEFTVNSNGPDDAGAEAFARATSLERDDLGDVVVLRASYPKPGSQRSTIVMHVPSRMVVRIESSQGADVADVAAVHLESMRGKVTVTNVAGAVTGGQQDGALAVAGAQSIKLRLARTKGTFAKVSGGLTLDLRDAHTEITDSSGAVEVDETRSDVTISAHNGPLAVRGNDGSITITRPTAETRVDVRRAEVELLIETAVPLTAITSDQPLRLVLAGSPAFTLDAAATDAGIQAADVGLTAEVVNADAHVSHHFGGASQVRVTLRNSRGDIVLRKRP